MTAGSGIIHQEMPRETKGDMRGLQLWVNLPASRKMMDPRYRDIRADAIPVVREDNGIVAKIIAGSYHGVSGPMDDLVQTPSYFDVAVPAGENFSCDFPEDHTVFAYVLNGSGTFSPDEDVEFGAEKVILYNKGGGIQVTAGDSGVRFLLIAGQPIGEPVAWGGPIVMNTEEELKTAFREFREGTFIKVGSEP
jgi:redox-sensitive bicupin YhaK (pirin superfamily)